MKTLIQNYSSGLSTEPMYFNGCLSECGLESHLWADPNISAFDIFDSVVPDIFICHYKFLTNDIIKYLSQNKKIQVILNVTGANDDELNIVEQIYEANQIKTPFIFTNQYDFIAHPKPKKIKLVNIMPAADLFLPPSPLPDFEIDLAVISTGLNDIIKAAVKNKDVYHLLLLGKEDENFDLPVDIKSMTSLYSRYKEIILVDNINIVSSQILFDASLKSRKLSIRVRGEEQEMLDKLLATLFHAEPEAKDAGEIIRNQIKRKHTCFNRTARLTRLLKTEEASRKLQSMSEQL